MRRVLISLGVVGLVALGLIIATPFIQARRLAKQLRVDVDALRAREIPRVPPVGQPLHDNGFSCLHGALARTPKDLEPFRRLTPDTLDVGPWVRGDEPIGTLPAPAVERLVELTPWVSELRSCGSSRMLRFVDGFDPWWWDSKAVTGINTFIRVSTLQVFRLLANDQAEDAIVLCESTFATMFDLGHVNLLGAMLGASTGSQLQPACARALSQTSLAVRERHAARWTALPSRIVTNPEWLDTERVNVAATMFLPLTDEPPLTTDTIWATNDVDVPMVLRIFRHHLVRGNWRAWDDRMRRMAAGEAGVSRELPGVLTPLSSDLSEVPDYEPFARRLATQRENFNVLVWLANGAHDAPPIGARVDGGVEFPTADGGAWFLPLTAE